MPNATPVACPVLLMVAPDEFDEVQFTNELTSLTVPSAYVALAEYCRFPQVAELKSSGCASGLRPILAGRTAARVVAAPTKTVPSAGLTTKMPIDGEEEPQAISRLARRMSPAKATRSPLFFKRLPQ